MSGGGTNTVETSSAPPAAFTNAYSNVVGDAQYVASQPYQPYTGSTVAPLSQDQNTGIAAVENVQGAANPYISTAASDIGASTAPLAPTYQPYGQAAGAYYNNAGSTNLGSALAPDAAQAASEYGVAGTAPTASGIAQYESPYTGQVVGATEAQLANVNAQQQQQVTGNAVSSGAWGGDRSGVAQGIAAGQEALSEAPTIAGLENQGYTQALGEFNTQQQQALATGQGYAGLGAESVTAAQGTGQLQLGAGQGISSIGSTTLGANEANAWLDSQAGYGEANLGNEALSTGLTGANALLGTGALEQGQAQANLNVPYEQYAAEQAYPFQTTQYLANISEGLGSASGGTSSTTSPAPSVASQVGGLGITGLGAYGLLNNAGATTGIANGIGDILAATTGTDTALGATALGTEEGATAGGAGLGALESLGFFAPLAARGGAIPHRDDGGSTPGAADDASEIMSLAAINAINAMPAALGNRDGGRIEHRPMGGGIGNVIRLPRTGIAAATAHAPRIGGIGAHTNDNLTGPGFPRPQRMLAGGGGIADDSWDTPDDAGGQVSVTTTGGGPPQPPSGGIGATAAHRSGDTGGIGATGNGTNLNPWLTLMATGLGIAGGTSPHAGVNIGRGGLEGLQFGEQQGNQQAQRQFQEKQLAQTGQYQQGMLGLEGKKADQAADLKRVELAQTEQLRTAELAQTGAFQKGQLGMEGARLAQERAFQNASLVPPEIRTAQAYEKMTPEQQTAFRQMQMSSKGLTDMFGQPTAASATQPDSATSAPVTGDAYLKTLNPQVQPVVKALAEGRMAMPTRPSPQQQQLIYATSQYDPTFDATDFNKRNRTATDFSPAGQSGKAVTAINTTMGHLSELQDRMDALGNTDLPAWNSVRNWASSQTGSAAPLTAQTTRDAVSNELRKVFATTGGGGLEELKEWEGNFPTNASPAQAKAAIRQAVTLMDSRLNSLGNQFSTGMGTNHSGIDLLSPPARAAYEKITGEQPDSANTRSPIFNPQQRQTSTSQPQQQQTTRPSLDSLLGP